MISRENRYKIYSLAAGFSASMFVFGNHRGIAMLVFGVLSAIFIAENMDRKERQQRD